MDWDSVYYKCREETLSPLNVKNYFLIGGIPFLVYGILGGLIVPKGDFFPSNWLNTESFLAVVKVPVQVFRAICAVAIAWTVAGILRVFNWETREKLRESQRRLESQLNDNIRLTSNLSSLCKISKDILTEFDVKRLLRKIANEACRLMGCKYSAVGILSDKGGYEYFITSGIPQEKVEDMKASCGLPSGKGILGFLMRTHYPVCIDDISKHPASVGFPEGHPKMKTLLGAPIVLHNKVIGRLYFTDKLNGENFTEEDKNLAMPFASTISLAINNTLILKGAEDLASFPEKSPYPILECDMDCNITYSNPTAQKFINELGIEAKKLLPSDLCEIVAGMEVFGKEVSYHEFKVDGSS